MDRMNVWPAGRDSQPPAVRKGPWTLEEDLVLVNYISHNGEGSWDSLAQAAGLNRDGKRCRLRWLNYLRPGVRRGTTMPEEGALIRPSGSPTRDWGILPGRTDNDVKNYWRTRIPRKHTSTHQQSCCRAPGMAGHGHQQGRVVLLLTVGKPWAHGQGSSAASGEWQMQPNPDHDQQAYYDRPRKPWMLQGQWPLVIG